MATTQVTAFNMHIRKLLKYSFWNSDTFYIANRFFGDLYEEPPKRVPRS